MKNYKVIILGPQCSGKTTLKKYLSADPTLPLIEEDELFTELNGGTYPQDIDYKENTLRSQLENKIKESNNLIFLTSYMSPSLLKELKTQGYKVIQLLLDQDEFKRRNEKRMMEDGYDDANVWAKDVFGFHDQIQKDKLADLLIQANQPTDIVAQEVLNFVRF